MRIREIKRMRRLLLIASLIVPAVRTIHFCAEALAPPIVSAMPGTP